MNVYVVVEGGSTEPAVYRKWIPLINPQLSAVDYITQVTQNNFLLISGNGYPAIYSVISSAIKDTTNNLLFDRLVISVDADDDDSEDRRQKIEAYVTALSPRVPVKVVVQNVCFETWALGNRLIGPRAPRDPKLRAYQGMHNVTIADPELLPGLPVDGLNRAQFAGKYLRACFREKNLVYSKSAPEHVAHPKYFHQLKMRLEQTGHISSFQSLLDAFS